MKVHIVITALFIFSYPVFSAISGTAKVKGIIVAYDKNTVTLSQKGKRVKVPIKSIPEHFKIKSGNEVYALFTAEEVAKKRQEAIEKEKKPVTPPAQKK